MTFSEAMLHIYAALVFCVVVFSTVVIITVWRVNKRIAQKTGKDGNNAE